MAMIADEETKPGQGWAWWFHHNLGDLERAYEASRATTDAEVARIDKTAKDHAELVDAGKATWSEENEEGENVYDYGEHLGEMMYEAEQALGLVRNAFVISLHHFIEMRIADQLPNKKYVEAAAFEWLESHGWEPRKDNLKQLRLAANCAKHSSGTSATQLYALRPDMFDIDKIEGWGMKPSYDCLKITDAHLQEFFQAARDSVPRMPFAWA